MSEGVKETEEGVNKVGGMEVKVGGEELEGIRELSQETASYYGWMNLLCYNVSVRCPSSSSSSSSTTRRSFSVDLDSCRNVTGRLP